MIRRFTFGTPFSTPAVVRDLPAKKIDSDASALSSVLSVEIGTSLSFSRVLKQDTIVYGLGETMRGINKRGGRYVMYNTDDPNHCDTMPSLYGTHSFVILDTPEEEAVGLFFDTPSRMVFEIDYKSSGKLIVQSENPNLDLYVLIGSSSHEVAREFHTLIGPGFLPPLWAFGFMQSRWGYRSEADLDDVIANYRKNRIPLDSVCMDIDYMDRFIDFSVNKKTFPDLKSYVEKKKKEGIRLVPIIDAGIKIEPGNPVYDEGIAGNHFCTNEKGTPFKAAVWPGMTHFPDFFRPETRKWFGHQYKALTDLGFEGFWNDMNEPSIFFSEYSGIGGLFSVARAFFFPEKAEQKGKREPAVYKDYRRFYHNIDGKRVNHHDVHNLFGSLMIQASGEGLSELLDHRYLLFARSSYIGAHRYGGIWTGDNASKWEHLRANVCQMPGLNMAGFLYSGADTGGFGGNADEELLLRWLAFSCFTPLMRDHTSKGTANQECYRFPKLDAFRSIVGLRYRLLPYLYSEFMKSILNGDLYMKPLAFLYPDDPDARACEDQLLVGESLMIAPVLEKGAAERSVYLPEDMTMVRYNGVSFDCTKVIAGKHIVPVALHEVVFFLLPGKAIPVAKEQVQCTDELDLCSVEKLGSGSYAQYVDDGISRSISADCIRII